MKCMISYFHSRILLVYVAVDSVLFRSGLKTAKTNYEESAELWLKYGYISTHLFVFDYI